MDVPLTPLAFLDRTRRLFADRVGVHEGDRHWTYGEMGRRVDRLSWALRALGVRPGDRVAWLGGNTHELLEAYYAVPATGALLVPLNIRLAAAELRAIIADCRPAVLIRHPDQPDPGAPVGTVILGAELEELLADQPDEPYPRPPVDERAPAEIFYTSGSTGRPRGAVLTHRGLYLHAVHNALTMGLTGEDVIVHTIPLFHVNGWGTPHFLTALGGVHVMLPRFDPAEVVRLIDRHGVTRLFVVPTMLRAILDAASDGRADLSSVRQVSVGGAPAPPTLLAEAEARFGCPVICGYGMTEASPTVTRSLDPPGAAPDPERRATTGIPILGVDARVLDDTDREVPADGRTVGEICVRSNHVMAGYWNDPVATAEALRGGWLRTGDLAVVRPDGYLRIVDRRKDVIVSGGENISSVEIEHVLTAHPAVKDAAVIGVPHPRWGERPVAYVTLQTPPSPEGAGGPQAADPDLPGKLREWCRGRLAGFKVPDTVIILDALPTGGTGKVSKPALRERWAAEDGPAAASPGPA